MEVSTTPAQLIGVTSNVSPANLNALTGGGATSLHSHSIQYLDKQLTNAQILALVSTPIQLVAAPASGLMLVPWQAVIVTATPTTAYTNIAATASIVIENGTVDFNLQGRMTLSWNGDDVSQILHFTGTSMAFGSLDQLTNTPSVATSIADGGDATVYDGTPIILLAQNGGQGNFTGGNAANTMSIRVWYSIVPAVPFGA